MAAQKHPELEAMLATLQAERDAITAKSAPLRAERQQLRVQITPALDRIRALDKEIHAAEQPRLAQVHAQITGLQKAMPAKVAASPPKE